MNTLRRYFFLLRASVRKHTRLTNEQPALAISEVLTAHRSDAVLSALKKANIRYVFVMADCTDEINHLDQQTINKIYNSKNVSSKLVFGEGYSKNPSSKTL